jgi:oxygen-independent coproporphyrinogen-3 oxidase
LYLGGGTPSLLDPDELGHLVVQIGRYFDVSGVKEFTLEANPEDVSPSMVRVWRSMGVNRVSLGIQSFDDRNLSRMNRAHTADQAREALRLLQDGGFHSLSADLIYGFPDRTMEEFGADLQELISWGLPHFSSYQLTVEPRTALYHQVKQNKFRMVSEDIILEQMMHMYQVSADRGYKAYEISNFAIPGHEAVHNSRYWSGYAYWGLGPSAHSYDGIRSRSWNVAHNTRYVAEIQTGMLPATVEVLTDDQRFNEAVLIGLRLMDGLSWQALEDAHGAVRVQSIRHKISLMPQEWFDPLGLVNSRMPLRLSPVGRAVADFIAVELFADS